MGSCLNEMLPEDARWGSALQQHTERMHVLQPRVCGFVRKRGAFRPSEDPAGKFLSSNFVNNPPEAAPAFLGDSKLIAWQIGKWRLFMHQFLNRWNFPLSDSTIAQTTERVQSTHVAAEDCKTQKQKLRSTLSALSGCPVVRVCSNFGNQTYMVTQAPLPIY